MFKRLKNKTTTNCFYLFLEILFIFYFILFHLISVLLLQLVRVQSPEGIKRIEISTKANLKELYESVQNALKVDGFGLFKERNFTKEVSFF